MYWVCSSADIFGNFFQRRAANLKLEKVEVDMQNSG